MIRHGCAGRFYNAFRIDTVLRCDGLRQRRVAITVVAIDFELLQIDRQFAKWKWRHAARCEIETHAALRLRPMHVVRVLVSHESVQCNTAILTVGTGGILSATGRTRCGEPAEKILTERDDQ